MPKVKALTPHQAKRTLANRFVGRADRLRQLNTKFGLRPYRVWLVWTKSTGEERGEGKEVVVRRTELLPTPRVVDLTVTYASFPAGVNTEGMLKLTEVSQSYPFDVLKGLYVPEQHEDEVPQPYDFYYEVAEDGRGENPEQRNRYRLYSTPFRQPGKVMWSITLESTFSDEDREGTPLLGGGRLNRP